MKSLKSRFKDWQNEQISELNKIFNNELPDKYNINLVGKYSVEITPNKGGSDIYLFITYNKTTAQVQYKLGDTDTTGAYAKNLLEKTDMIVAAGKILSIPDIFDKLAKWFEKYGDFK